MEAYQELEKRFGEWTGCDNPNTVAVSSGTSALHVALEALELPQGSEIIIPDFTMVACPRAAVMAGLKPVFVDCGPDLLIDTSLLKYALRDKTKAIMAVHIYGRRCNMVAIHSFAGLHGLKVIEDLAEIHGVKPHTDTDAACWSFYRNKIIAGEEGGMIAFKSQHAEDRARSLRSLGFTPEHDFNHIPRGVNARMSNAHAELIIASLKAYEWNYQKRRVIESLYNSFIPLEWKMPKRDAVWVYDILCPRGIDTARLVKNLNEGGCAARLGFKPMSKQKEFYTKCCVSEYGTSIASEMSQRIIYLPVDSMQADDTVTVRRYSTLLLSLLSPAVQ